MTQHKARSANFGPSWPEVAGFGAAGPNKQFLGFDRREKTKNVQVSRHLPCLPFSGKAKISLDIEFTLHCIVEHIKLTYFARLLQ